MKVSIVTVCKNAEKNIEETIKSVEKQKESNDIEYIIVDGLSSDNTMSIISDYDDVVDVVISEDDNGIYDAMNKGAAYATGDIIAFLNAGDRYIEDAISKVTECFEKNDADVVYGDAIVTHEGEKIYVREAYEDCSRILVLMIACHQAVFVKAKEQKKYGFGSRYTVGADRELLFKIFYAGGRFERLSDVLCYYDDSGFSSVNHKMVRKDTFTISYDIFEEHPELKLKYPQMYEEFISMLSQLYSLNHFDVNNMPDVIRTFWNKKIPKSYHIYVWGVEIYCIKSAEFLSRIGVNVIGFIDDGSDDRIIGTYRVYSSSNIVPDNDSMIIIATQGNTDEILKKINSDSKFKGIRCVMISDLFADYSRKVLEYARSQGITVETMMKEL